MGLFFNLLLTRLLLFLTKIYVLTFSYCITSLRTVDFKTPETPETLETWFIEIIN